MGSYGTTSSWGDLQALPTSILMQVSNGKKVEVPVPGYGTISEEPETLPGLVSKAIEAGVRHLDCAWEYGVDMEVGEGIRQSGPDRSEIFITQKVNPHFYHPDHISICLDQMLKKMKTPYIDLLLLHLPVALKPLPDIEKAEAYPGSTAEQRRIATTEDNLWIIDAAHSPRNLAELNGETGSIIPTWNAMKELVRKGLVRAIGVSNFSIVQLKEILDDENYMKDNIPLSVNEIEVSPYCQSKELLSFMKERSITALGHSPFASNKWLYKQEEGDWIFEPLVPKTHGVSLLRHPVIKGIAESYGADPGQVVQSWIAAKGVVPLGRSTSLDRVKRNLDLRILKEEEMQSIDRLDCPGRDGRGLIMENVFPGIKFPSDENGP